MRSVNISFVNRAYTFNPVSASVENAEPTKVVLTFPDEKLLQAGDFTIAGFTINSAVWTGTTLTLTLSTSVTQSDTLVVTFINTGQTISVVNNVTSSPVVPSELLLTFSDIAKASQLIGGDASLVEDWNTFFTNDWELTGNFTGVVINGNIVNLQGGANITLNPLLYTSQYKPGTIVDTLGCVMAILLNDTSITEPPDLTKYPSLNYLILVSCTGLDLSDIDSVLTFYGTLRESIILVALYQAPPIIPTPATLAAAEAANPQAIFYVDIATPSIGTPVVISDTQINIPFTSANPVSIEISTDGEEYVEAGTADADESPFNAIELTAGTLYYFKVRAYLGAVYSAYSGVVSAFTTINTLLADTNTATYYKYDEPAKINKDSSNRVKVWSNNLTELSNGNVVVNGDFSSATGWNLQTGWSIADGLAIAANATGQCYRAGGTLNKYYKVTFTCTEYTSGTFVIILGGDEGITRSSTGTFTDYIKMTVVGQLGIYGAGLTAKFDNFIVEEILDQLEQYTDAAKPTINFNSISFDGVNDYLQTKAMTLNQPVNGYALIKNTAFIANSVMIDGKTVTTMFIPQFSNTGKKSVYLYAGTDALVEGAADVVNGDWYVLRFLASGAASEIAIDSNSKSTGTNPGTGNPGGLTIGNNGTFIGTFSNIELKDLIIRKVNDSDENETTILNYLINRKLNIPVYQTYNNILVLGNSLALIPTVYDHWWGVWGMAATIQANDYVHKLQTRVKLINPNCTVTPHNIAAWETDHTTYDKTNFDSFFTNVPDLVIIQVGDNISSETGLSTSYQALITYILSKAPNCKIVCLGTFWQHDTMNATFKSVAVLNGLPFAPLFDLNANHPTIGDTVYDANGDPHLIDDAGVAAHPNDTGHNLIANKIYNMIN